MPISVAADTVLVAAADGARISGPVVIVVAAVAAIVYLFGYLRAVMHRANVDYKATKASLKPLRRGFWQAWWGAVKMGFWVVLAAAAMVTWLVHDVREAGGGERTPAPASVSPAPSRSR